MAIASARGKLIGVIGDEDTCVGFLLGGIGKYKLLAQVSTLTLNNSVHTSCV